jgi:hypothetical protein
VGEAGKILGSTGGHDLGRVRAGHEASRVDVNGREDSVTASPMKSLYNGSSESGIRAIRSGSALRAARSCALWAARGVLGRGEVLGRPIAAAGRCFNRSILTVGTSGFDS